jgi:O-antigen/teichoic acid export membrane protein
MAIFAVVISQRYSTLGNLLIAGFMIPAANLMPTWIFQGQQKIHLLTGIQIVIRIIWLGAIMLFVLRPSDLRIALALEVAATSISTAAALITVPLGCSISFITPAWLNIKRAFIESVPFFISGFAGTLYANSLILVAGISGSADQVGYFAIADRIVSAIKKLQIPIVQGMYPHVNALRAQSTDTALLFLRKMWKWALLLGFASMVLLAITARFVIQIVAGISFPDATLALQIMSSVPGLVLLSNILGVQVLFSFGFSHVVANVQAAIACLSLAAAVVGSTYAGAAGLAIVCTLTEVTITACYFAITRAKLNFP